MYYLRLLYIALILFKTYAIILGSIDTITPIKIPHNNANFKEHQANQPSLLFKKKNINSPPSTCFSFVSDSRFMDEDSFPYTPPVLNDSGTICIHKHRNSGLRKFSLLVNQNKKNQEINKGLSKLNINENAAHLNLSIHELEKDSKSDDNYYNESIADDARSESNYEKVTISDNDSNYQTAIKNIELENQENTINIIEIDNDLSTKEKESKSQEEEMNKNKPIYNNELPSTIEAQNLLNQQGKIVNKQLSNSPNYLLHIGFYIIIVISLGSIIAAVVIKFCKYKKPQEK